MEGARELPYAIANNHVDYHMLQVPVPTMVWRTTGFGPNTFVLETVLDELAGWSKQDPYRYRRRLLVRNAAALAVLDRAAALANWGKAPKGRFQGIAFADCFGTYLCQIVEISLVNGAVKLHKVVSVADPGRVFDRVNAASNIEGGVMWGLTATLYSELTFEAGHVRERNFDDFAIAQMSDTPEMVTEFLEGRKGWAASARSVRSVSGPRWRCARRRDRAEAPHTAACARRRAHGLAGGCDGGGFGGLIRMSFWAGSGH